MYYIYIHVHTHIYIYTYTHTERKRNRVGKCPHDVLHHEGTLSVGLQNRCNQV